MRLPPALPPAARNKNPRIANSGPYARYLRTKTIDRLRPCQPLIRAAERAVGKTRICAVQKAEYIALPSFTGSNIRKEKPYVGSDSHNSYCSVVTGHGEFIHHWGIHPHSARPGHHPD